MKADYRKSEKKHEISSRLTRGELFRTLRDLEMKLFYNRLVIDGESVRIPKDAKIEFKIKYEDEHKYVLAIKIEWAKEIQPSIQVEVEEVEDDC